MTTNLNYTTDEYNSWNSYTPIISLYTPIDRFLTSDYKTAFNDNLNNFYNEGYHLYDGIIRGNYNILKQLKINNNFDEENLMIYTSYVINNEYNKTNKFKIINKTILDFDFFSNVQIQLAIKNFEKIMMALWDVQSFTHTSGHDTYGVLQNEKSYGKGINLQNHEWTSYKYITPLCHFAHLCSNDFLYKMRKHIQASMTAQWNILRWNGDEYITSDRGPTSQWLQGIVGVVIHLTFMLQSEKILKERGIWEQKDVIIESDKINGIWANDDINKLANEMIDVFIKRTTIYGFRESLSTYYSFCLNLILRVLLHAPSQEIFNKFEWIWKCYWQDITSNYLISSNSISGPMNRTYNPCSGVEQGLDNDFLQQLLMPFFIANKIKMIPLSAKVQFTFWVFEYQMRCAGGSGYLPYDYMQINIANPIKIVQQRIANVRGQDKYNFITPNFSLGHMGDDQLFTSNSVHICGRIGGLKNNIKENNKYCLNYMFMMTESTGEPFINNGIDQQLTNRLVVSQYLNFMLVTSLVTPSSNQEWKYPETFFKPLNTNLVLPLDADGLYADDIKLPITIGTNIAMPLKTIYTIKHKIGDKWVSMIIRLCYFEKSNYSNITDVDIKKEVLISNDIYKQPYSIMWQVDKEGYDLGSGRITIHHKHDTDSSMKPYYVTWLIGIIDDLDIEEMKIWEKYMRDIKIEQKIDNNMDGMTEGREGNLSITVNIGEKKLHIDRKDIFMRRTISDTFIMNPYNLKSFNRLVDGKPCSIFEGENINSFSMIPVESIYRPYL